MLQKYFQLFLPCTRDDRAASVLWAQRLSVAWRKALKTLCTSALYWPLFPVSGLHCQQVVEVWVELRNSGCGSCPGLCWLLSNQQKPWECLGGHYGHSAALQHHRLLSGCLVACRSWYLSVPLSESQDSLCLWIVATWRLLFYDCFPACLWFALCTLAEWNAGGGPRVRGHAVHLEELLSGHPTGAPSQPGLTPSLPAMPPHPQTDNASTLLVPPSQPDHTPTPPALPPTPTPQWAGTASSALTTPCPLTSS